MTDMMANGTTVLTAYVYDLCFNMCRLTAQIFKYDFKCPQPRVVEVIVLQRPTQNTCTTAFIVIAHVVFC